MRNVLHAWLHRLHLRLTIGCAAHRRSHAGAVARPPTIEHAAGVSATFERWVEAWFGSSDEPITAVENRTPSELSDRAIVWEGNAQTFQFSYVSPSAERLLGYPAERWTTEPTFWADLVIMPADRDDAVAYCALATTKRADHVFEYRARHANGSTVWLRDYVTVVVGPRGLARSLRGIMVDISAEKRATETFGEPATYRLPDRQALEALG